MDDGAFPVRCSGAAAQTNKNVYFFIYEIQSVARINESSAPYTKYENVSSNGVVLAEQKCLRHSSLHLKHSGANVEVVELISTRRGHAKLEAPLSAVWPLAETC